MAWFFLSPKSFLPDWVLEYLRIPASSHTTPFSRRGTLHPRRLSGILVLVQGEPNTGASDSAGASPWPIGCFTATPNQLEHGSWNWENQIGYYHVTFVKDGSLATPSTRLGLSTERASPFAVLLLWRGMEWVVAQMGHQVVAALASSRSTALAPTSMPAYSGSSRGSTPLFSKPPPLIDPLQAGRPASRPPCVAANFHDREHYLTSTGLEDIRPLSSHFPPDAPVALMGLVHEFQTTSSYISERNNSTGCNYGTRPRSKYPALVHKCRRVRQLLFPNLVSPVELRENDEEHDPEADASFVSFISDLSSVLSSTAEEERSEDEGTGDGEEAGDEDDDADHKEKNDASSSIASEEEKEESEEDSDEEDADEEESVVLEDGTAPKKLHSFNIRTTPISRTRREEPSSQPTSPFVVLAITQMNALLRAPRCFQHPSWLPKQALSRALDPRALMNSSLVPLSKAEDCARDPWKKACWFNAPHLRKELRGFQRSSRPIRQRRKGRSRETMVKTT
ncbi:hypothetical protein M407DRAFT_224796 [Tulasnella calospora MUT 4182]|uniref:Uncharacterized protein n=1 Tax=Tulasnella calospora MUT 4182 TaxID=1051891 RepID=A0A0C3LB62_9AGAM|nr:hypothetical protein M407DRAFT_224796 [Tulasnella calospora MUT 4182]